MNTFFMLLVGMYFGLQLGHWDFAQMHSEILWRRIFVLHVVVQVDSSRSFLSLPSVMQDILV